MKTYTTQAISGFILFIAGLLCIAFPVMGALDVEAMLGVLILLSGIFHLVGAAEQKHAPEFIWGMFNSFAYIGFGLFLIADPYGAMELLAVAVFLFLLIHGFFTLLSAFKQKAFHSRWFWTLFSALLSFSIATIIFFGFPGGNAWTIGMLTGVAMLGYGISLLVISGVVSSEDKASPAKLKPAPKATKAAAPEKKAAPKKKTTPKKK